MGSKTFGISNLMLFDSINKYNYINHKHIERSENYPTKTWGIWHAYSITMHRSLVFCYT